MQPIATTNPPDGFQVKTAREGQLVINHRRVGPPWFMWTFYFVSGGWLLGWLLACVFLTYQALAARKVPLWVAVLFWVCGIVGFRYVFILLFWRLHSVTSFIFYEDQLVIENIFLTRRTSRKVDKRDVRIVRQVCENGWGLLLEGPANLKLLSHEEFQTSAWLGSLVAQWAGVSYEPSARLNDNEAS